MTSRSGWFLSFVVAIALLLAGCGSRETRVEEGTRTQVLHLGNGAEPQDLDPHICTAYTDYNILIALFEGLTVIDETSSQAIPGTAARWDVSDDGLVYTFHLRPDAKWSNGDPVTAGDFVFSYQRILSAALGAEYAYMLYPLANAEAYHTGQIANFAEVGVRALDDRTLRLTLAAPTPYLLALIAHQAWFPVHPPTVLAHGRIDQRGTRWTRPGNFTGNGAFALKAWEPNSRIVVEKNPHYWNAAANRLHGVVFYPNDNIAADESAFRAGQLHVTFEVLPDRIDHYRRTAPEQIRVDPFLESYFIRFNTTRPPLDDVRVRRALTRAIDREAIATVLLSGSRLPAYHFTPPDTAGFTAEARVTTDFASARALLAEAGFPGGRGFPTLNLQMNTDAINAKVLEAVQAMWKRELGIDVTLSNADFRVYLDHMRTLNYDLTRARWIGDYNDPNTYLDMFVTGGGNNQTGWSNATYDRLIADAGRTADPAQRFALFQQAEAILLDEVPLAPVFFGTRTYLIHPSVKNWVPSLLGIHRYQTVWLE
jgi:oligopeptide transport system substrate-binding protein